MQILCFSVLIVKNWIGLVGSTIEVLMIIWQSVLSHEYEHCQSFPLDFQILDPSGFWVWFLIFVLLSSSMTQCDSQPAACNTQMMRTVIRACGLAKRSAPTKLFTTYIGSKLIEFSLNVFTASAEFSNKKYYILKRLFKPATSYVRDQDATTAPAKHS